MFRFFVDQKQGDHFVLNDDIIHHIKVARIKNEKIICIYQHKFYICQLVDKRAKIINQLDDNNEFDGHLVLAVALIAKKRFELLIEKATELGVKTIIPVLCKNVSSKIHHLQKNIDRWKAIAKSAAQQSFRNIVPHIHDPMPLAELVKIDLPNKFIAHEKTTYNNLALLPSNAIFLVGPEGGFSEQEISLATKHKFQVININKRILRTETAAIFILSRVSESKCC